VKTNLFITAILATTLVITSIEKTAIASKQGINIKAAFNSSGSIQNTDTVINKYRPLECKQSSSPLFQDNSNDILKLEIISDFKHINEEIYSETGGDSGIISYADKNGVKRYIPVFIKDRGNSRRDFCEWVPLRITFENSNIKDSLDKLLKNIPSDNERLVKMYQQLKSIRKNNPLTKGVSQKNNIFSKLGDDVKLVTHCGKSTWKRVGGDTREEQEQRLLQEYYIYKILDQMNTTILKIRLAEITYRDPDGNIILTRKAFFREPKSRLAKRCGLSNKPYSDVENKEINDISWFQLELYNEFVYFKDYGRDGRNVNMLYRKDGEIFVGPFDFDLSGIIVPDYRPNSNTMEKNLQDYFQSWIKLHDGNEMAIVQIFFLVNKHNKMRSIIENSLLNKKNKTHMLLWFDSYMNTLKKFIEWNKKLMPELIRDLE